MLQVAGDVEVEPPGSEAPALPRVPVRHGHDQPAAGSQELATPPQVAHRIRHVLERVVEDHRVEASGRQMDGVQRPLLRIDAQRPRDPDSVGGRVDACRAPAALNERAGELPSAASDIKQPAWSFRQQPGEGRAVQTGRHVDDA